MIYINGTGLSTNLYIFPFLVQIVIFFLSSGTFCNTFMLLRVTFILPRKEKLLIALWFLCSKREKELKKKIINVQRMKMWVAGWKMWGKQENMVVIRSWLCQDYTGNHRTICNLHPNSYRENESKQHLRNPSFQLMVWRNALIPIIWNKGKHKVLFFRGKYQTEILKSGNK